MAEIDKARWARLSPLLDELLDLAPEQRPARLQALRQQAELGPELSTDLIEDLAELLRRQEALEDEDFLASPALSVAEAASAHNQAGQTVGAYTLEREIGQGGMGTVWLARRTDGRFEGQVAIKFLNTGLLGRGDAGRFAREGQILARLTHPHIARLIDAGVAPEHQQPYLVLEYIDGLPLDRFCVERGLDCEARVRLFLDVLAAVAHAHTRLILHRDLKPTNILVTAAGEVKLLDFGIAKLLHRAGDDDTTPPGAATELTRVAGRAYTPRYAAPEQMQGGEVTTATDVYALGVLLYLLLSGQHPTEGRDEAQTTPLERLRTLVEVEPKKVSERVPSGVARQLRGDLDTIVAKALKKAPAERYANAAALAEDLRRWLGHEPILARPDRPGYILRKFLRRHRVWVAAGSAAVLGLSSLTALSLSQARRAEQAEHVARQRSSESDELLSYLLGEFADKLRPVGRLDLLDSVGAKALAHLGAARGANAAPPSPQARLQQAKALTVLGEVQVSKLQLDAAVAPLQSAQALLAQVQPEPELAGPWYRAQGAAAFWLGHVHYTQRHFAEARQQFEAYRDFSQAWLDAAPGELDAMVELSYALNSLGSLQLDSGDLPEATRLFQASIALKQRALSQDPQQLGLKAELADSLTWLGTALLWQGELQQARTLFIEALRDVEANRALAPADLDWTARAATVRDWIAQAEAALKHTELAQEQYRAAAELMRKLLRQDPNERGWQQQLQRIEAGQLALRSHTRAAQLAQAKALDQALREQAQKASAAAGLRRLPLRVKVGLELAAALEAAGQAQAAGEALAQWVDALQDGLKRSPTDLPLLDAFAQQQLALAAWRSQHESAAAGAALCQALVTQLDKQRPLLRVHHGITRSWVRAHSCLNREAEVKEERDWLEQRR